LNKRDKNDNLNKINDLNKLECQNIDFDDDNDNVNLNIDNNNNIINCDKENENYDDNQSNVSINKDTKSNDENSQLTTNISQEILELNSQKELIKNDQTIDKKKKKNMKKKLRKKLKKAYEKLNESEIDQTQNLENQNEDLNENSIFEPDDTSVLSSTMKSQEEIIESIKKMDNFDELNLDQINLISPNRNNIINIENEYNVDNSINK